MEKISYPLHYKFEKYDNSVRWFFKGTHNSEWIQIEDNILTKLPQGQPKSLKPDYSKINIDKNLKQVKQLKNLFKSQFSMTFWEEFYKNINDGTRYIPHTNWILNQLPRQQVAQIEISAPIPDYVREIVNKETTVPQVNIVINQSFNWIKSLRHVSYKYVLCNISNINVVCSYYFKIFIIVKLLFQFDLQV